MVDEPDLVERLRYPAWAHSDAPNAFPSPQLDKETTLADMVAAAAEITKLSAERDAAARALRPFADVVGDLHERAENDDNIWESPAAMNLTAGHLREALYVLSMLPESDAPAGPVIATDGKDAT